MQSTEIFNDIGQLASFARTALDDPSGLPEDEDAKVKPSLQPSVNAGLVAYAVDRLDDIIAITDPVDDERFFERCADSFDALGRAIEHIREEIANMDSEYDHFGAIRVVQDTIPSALDLLDTAVQELRAIAEEDKAVLLQCEDCAVNGEACHTHGEAFKLARYAILSDPDRVVALLKGQP